MAFGPLAYFARLWFGGANWRLMAAAPSRAAQKRRVRIVAAPRVGARPAGRPNNSDSAPDGVLTCREGAYIFRALSRQVVGHLVGVGDVVPALA
jgi:hypothetical protein